MKKEIILKKQKNNNLFYILLGITIVVVISAVVLYFIIGNLSNEQSNLSSASEINNTNLQNSQSNNPSKTCTNVQVPYNYLEQYQETVPYSDRECEAKELAYSITNFVMNANICNKQEYICKDTFLGICTEKQYYCVDKTVSCSLDLKNLDSEKMGTWAITMNYIDTSTRVTVRNEPLNRFLYAQTQDTLNSAINIQSSGQTGDANRELTCNYQVITIPTKQVCRDVTKYQEVTKTRTVTRYRTEQQCN